MFHYCAPGFHQIARSFRLSLGLAAGFVLGSLMVPVFPPVQATENSNLPVQPLSIEAQRELFLSVEQQISQRRFNDARSQMQSLLGYPLYPYLEAEFLAQNLSYANEEVIAEFLNEYAGTPLDNSLRRQWLNFLIDQNDAERFLLYYQGSGNAGLQCRYLDYLWKTTDNLAALWPQVTNQWLSGESLPSTCDSVFNAWTEAGYRTEFVVWQRLLLATEARQYSLARYLTRLLPSDKRYLGELARRIQANPATVMQFELFPGQDEREQEIVLRALHRLVWRDIDQAKRAWQHYQQHFQYDQVTANDMHERIGITLAVRGEPNAREWLLDLPLATLSETGKQWALASVLKAGRWDQVVMLYNSLSSEEKEQGQWRYWRARALEQLRFDDESVQEFEHVAGSRSYYGFLAAARLQQAPQLQYEPVRVEPEQIAALRNEPSVQRALEFFKLNRLLEARREWNVIGMRGTYEQQVATSVLAHEEGWYDQAIFGLARTGHFHDVERRFPLAYRDLLQAQAEANGLDVAWVYAIARRESAFRADAVSPAGARGLLQVMPGTAQYVTRRTPGPNLGRVTNHRLLQPEDNVRIGTRYMADLMRRTNQNWIIATAGYNAGMNRVVEWLPQQPLDFDIWVENVPYQETRDYLKNVLAYKQIYSILLGNETQVLSPLISLQMYAEGSSG
ncbi:transglycosylase SLT domain-containing protein [Aliidiomarina celeris]|uniref:transglycosylase SLT domain-containing protein n=1 Tax=Aliidiomarina celeris TaxID=2249428 RepID=UPI000DE8CE47|nr:transglycosylase SLT domain-containing protein [Aliidiomarina celeris]